MSLPGKKNYHWHALVGLGVSLVAAFGHVVPWFAFLSALGIGFAHELADGCFTTKAGAPWSGVLDTLAFVPIPTLVLLWVHFHG